MSGEPFQHGTLADVVPSVSAGVALRRLGTALVVVWVGLGAAGVLGVRTGTVTDTSGDLSLTVRYPSVARAGNDAVLEMTIDSPDLAGGEVDVTVDRRYLDLWESQRFWPEPSAETASGDQVQLTFDAPDSGPLRIRFDGYIQPVAQRGRAGTVGVSFDGGARVSVGFSTVLLP